MKTATVRQIRNAFPDVLRHVRNGETVAITSRRKVVATLVPPITTAPPKPSRPWADLSGRLADLQRQPMLPITGAEMLAADRDRY